MKITLLNKYLSMQYIFLSFSLLGFVGCEKFVQINPPPNQLIDANVFNNDGSAISSIKGIYSQMTLSNGFASGATYSITQLAGLSADELTNFSNDGTIQQFANNSINSSNIILQGNLWNEIYNYIYTSNAILEGVNAGNGLSDSIKQELNGQAKFIRAFCYFYLTNLFGDVPLYTTSNYQINAVSKRTESVAVYNQIISDLKGARSLLSDGYPLSNGERVTPNKWAATALLARVYLYQHQWDSAETQSTAVINNSGQYSILPDLNTVFLANSSEAIWQLLPVQATINTWEGANFILIANPTSVALNNYLMSSFETGDLRLTSWVGAYSDGINSWNFAYKYKVKASSALTEYSMVLRLAEQYLIRAEARAQKANIDISGAQSDLNIIRTRAGLPNTTAGDQQSLLTSIAHERQIELFSEWGHRWLDLKRTNSADVILGAEKPSWQPNAKIYPIPSTEILNNSNITQNPGY